MSLILSYIVALYENSFYFRLILWQALNLIRAVQTVMKVPLIALNIMTIVMEVLFG